MLVHHWLELKHKHQRMPHTTQKQLLQWKIEHLKKWQVDIIMQLLAQLASNSHIRKVNWVLKLKKKHRKLLQCLVPWVPLSSLKWRTMCPLKPLKACLREIFSPILPLLNKINHRIKIRLHRKMQIYYKWDQKKKKKPTKGQIFKSLSEFI